MNDLLRYRHFDVLDAPIAVLSEEGVVRYRNRAALALSQKLRMGSCVFKHIAEGERPVKKALHLHSPVIGEISLDGSAHTVLFVPDRSPEERTVLMILAPLLEGELCYEPSAAKDLPSPAFKDVADLPDGRYLKKMGTLLVRSFSAAFASLPYSCLNEHPAPFTMDGACLFLNSLFERAFSCRAPNAFAKCTSDCLDMPLADHETLLSCLACIAVILAVNSADEKLEVTLSCEYECPTVSFFCRTAHSNAATVEEFFPGRRVELAILRATLDAIEWDADIRMHDEQMVLFMRCRRHVPAKFFKSPSSEDPNVIPYLVKRMLEKLLPPREGCPDEDPAH